MIRLLTTTLIVATVAACAQETATTSPQPRTQTQSAAQATSPIGKWGNGMWDNVLSTEIDLQNNTSAVYSWGAYSGWGVTPGSQQTVARVNGNEFTLGPMANGAIVNCVMNSSGTTADCTYTNRGGGVSTATLERLSS